MEMNKRHSSNIVMTLDAGGTNFVFSAISDFRHAVNPVTLPSCASSLSECIANIKKGFRCVETQLNGDSPIAISFAFPGPADYNSGVIGDLPNFPSFRGGVPLGPILEDEFGIPVYINNDGKLFAYGEAYAGALPEVNRRLLDAGSEKQYSNLLGVTLGTGFGGGVVIDGKMLTGDNGTGGDIWCFPNKKHPALIVEESVSIRAVRRVYQELSGDNRDLSPKDIYDIAEGTAPGDRHAAERSFTELGTMAGDAIATAVTLIDGIVVIGGGVSGASKYIVPAILKEMNGHLGMMDGTSLGRVQMQVYNLDDENDFAEFAKPYVEYIHVPGSGRVVAYDKGKKIGVMVSKNGANHSIACGAYMYALNRLENKK